MSGQIESVIDLREVNCLRPVVEVLRHFRLRTDLPKRALALGLEGPLRLVRTAEDLVQSLTEAQWRAYPMQFDVPSTSQIFGRIVMTAGVEAIIYPSTKTDQSCIAIFPAKIGGNSFVQLDPPYPPQVAHHRLDVDTFEAFV